MYVAAAADMMYDVPNDDADDDDADDDDAMMMYVAAAADMMYDVPNDDADDDDDDDAMKNQFSVECSQRPFASVYYLQLDSRTK